MSDPDFDVTPIAQGAKLYVKKWEDGLNIEDVRAARDIAKQWERHAKREAQLAEQEFNRPLGEVMALRIWAAWRRLLRK